MKYNPFFTTIIWYNISQLFYFKYNLVRLLHNFIYFAHVYVFVCNQITRLLRALLQPLQKYDFTPVCILGLVSRLPETEKDLLQILHEYDFILVCVLWYLIRWSDSKKCFMQPLHEYCLMYVCAIWCITRWQDSKEDMLQP